MSSSAWRWRSLANNPPLLLADALAVLPPGERVTVEVEPDRVVLRPTDRRSAGEAEEDGTP